MGKTNNYREGVVNYTGKGEKKRVLRTRVKVFKEYWRSNRKGGVNKE